MKMETRLLAGTAAALGLTASMAAAQIGPQEGPATGMAVSANDGPALLEELGNQLGQLRDNDIVWSQLNALEVVGNGSWVDLESGSIGEMQPVSKYTYQAAWAIPASRLDVEGPEMERVVRTVRGDLDQAWNASLPGYPTGDSENAAFREASIWLWPHAFARAAAYAEQGLCPDSSECPDVAFSMDETGDAPTITVEVEGVEYVATLSEDTRPARIEAEIDIPGVGPSTYVAHYSNYRNGLGLGASGEDVAEGLQARQLQAATDEPLARGEGSLDKFHTGAYIPGNVMHEVDGQPVLELEITEGWPNAFMIFPTPELLAAAE